MTDEQRRALARLLSHACVLYTMRRCVSAADSLVTDRGLSAAQVDFWTAYGECREAGLQRRTIRRELRARGLS